MKVIVCIKQVPDTEARIKVMPGEAKIATNDIKFIVNPYDEYAVEEALKIKEKLGGEVTAVTVGPQGADQALKECVAKGVDNIKRIWSDSLENIDPMTTAKILAKAIEGMEYDLVICGKQAIDDDAGQVGTMVADFLGIPHVAVVVKAELDGDTAKFHRQIEGGVEVVEAKLPALFTAQKGLNEPRYPSLKGKMKAKKKKAEIIDATGLGVDIAPRIKVIEMSVPEVRTSGTMIREEEPADAAKKLVQLLKEEAKVI